MDLGAYRESDSEIKRTEDLVRLIRFASDQGGEEAIDIGARDGHFSRLLAEHFQNVTALDLEEPSFHHENVNCVQGDITDVDFSDNSFDLVFCAEVLEHIPPQLLDKACSELSRVCRKFLLIGVPYKQDIRVGRTTCCSCGKKNPPWGHVNSFTESRITGLFPSFTISEMAFVGRNDASTNFISTIPWTTSGHSIGGMANTL